MHTTLAKDLFQKAIIERNYKLSKQVLYNLLVTDGIAPNTKAATVHAESMSNREIRDFLYRKSPADIAKPYFNIGLGPINWGDLFHDDIKRSSDHTSPPPLVQDSDNRPEFVYAIGEGYVLPKGLSFADFPKDHVFPKPTVIGTTRKESNAWNASWPLNYQEGKSLSTLVTEAVEGTNLAYRHMQRFYDTLGERNSETFKRNAKFATELIDELDTYLGAQMPARHLAASKEKVPVYVYRFDWGI